MTAFRAAKARVLRYLPKRKDMIAMTRSSLAAAPMLAALALLAGCESTGGPPAEITRFHAAAPIERGPIAIAAGPGLDPSGLEFQSYAAAIAPALQQAGFQPVAGGGSAPLVATINVRRSTFATPPRGPSFSFGIGGASFGRHSGVGGDVGVGGIGPGAHPGTGVGTELMIQIRRASDNAAIWEGRGRTSARIGTPAADPGAAVGRLAGALFAGFPGESGRTITLR